MNERIRQLAEQANELDYKTFDEYNHQTVQHYKFNKEKFAELIVRECIDTAFHKGHPDLEFLLKHFGVEE